MATTFAEAGSSSTFDLSMWNGTIVTNGAVASASDQVNLQPHSIKCTANTGASNRYGCVYASGVLADAGRRATFYLRFDALPSGFTNTSFSASNRIFYVTNNAQSTAYFMVCLDNTGKLRLCDSNQTSQATGTTTLSINTWYRVTVAYTITGNNANSVRVYLSAAGGGAGVLELTKDNLTATTGSQALIVGCQGFDATSGVVHLWLSDVYIDDSAALTDLGDIHVTAKRPFANGTTNGFSTTGSGSGYGTGNAAFVNERPLNTANLVSAIGAGSAITEEYNIEGASVGDVDLTGATLVDYVGWLYAKSLAGETGQLILNNVTGNISLTSSNTMFTRAAGSASYPAGTGTDIGIITDTSVTTVSLFEAGIIFAYIPGVAGMPTTSLLSGPSKAIRQAIGTTMLGIANFLTAPALLPPGGPPADRPARPVLARSAETWMGAPNALLTAPAVVPAGAALIYDRNAQRPSFRPVSDPQPTQGPLLLQGWDNQASSIWPSRAIQTPKFRPEGVANAGLSVLTFVQPLPAGVQWVFDRLAPAPKQRPVMDTPNELVSLLSFVLPLPAGTQTAERRTIGPQQGATWAIGPAQIMTAPAIIPAGKQFWQRSADLLRQGQLKIVAFYYDAGLTIFVHDENSVGGNPRLLRLRIRQINDTPRTFSRGNIRRLP